MISKVLDEEWCISLAVFTPTRNLFRAWLCCISSSSLLYMFRMKMHKIPSPPSRGHVTPHSWAFQSQANLNQSLGLFHWASSYPLQGTAETPAAKRGAAPRSLEHKGTVCKTRTSVRCCGSPGSFLFPGNAATVERSRAACPACCHPARALKPAGESLAALTLAEPASSLPLPQLCSLSPSRLSMEGFKVLQKPSQGHKSKLCWKGRVTGVFLDRKFHAGYQDHAEGISWPGFEALGPMVPCLPCLKTCTTCDLAVVFILGVCMIHLYTRVSHHMGRLWHTWVSCGTADVAVELHFVLLSFILMLFDYCFHYSFVWVLHEEATVWIPFSFFLTIGHVQKKKTIQVGNNLPYWSFLKARNL